MKEYEKLAKVNADYVCNELGFHDDLSIVDICNAYEAGFKKAREMAIGFIEDPNITSRQTDEEIKNLGEKEV